MKLTWAWKTSKREYQLFRSCFHSEYQHYNASHDYCIQLLEFLFTIISEFKISVDQDIGKDILMSNHDISPESHPFM